MFVSVVFFGPWNGVWVEEGSRIMRRVGLVFRVGNPVTDFPARGARLARRDDRAYREYLRKEQRSQTGCPARKMSAAFRLGTLGLGCVVCLAVLAVAPARAQLGTQDGEWRTFGGDTGSTKYAPLDQINRDNVRGLQIAWRRPAVDERYGAMDPEISYSNSYFAQVLTVGGVAYIPNGVGLVEAFNPGTGETIWVQEPMGGVEDLRGASTRGVAYWSDGSDERILVQRGTYLYALDARTGETYPDFGDAGRVDLRVGLGEGAQYRWGSAPLVIRDIVVLGQSMSDTFTTKEALRGDVRAFDVRTGELRWQFHTIPQAGEFGTDTWEGDSWSYTGHAPVWSLFSADEELGYVYMPVSSPTSDMYGGHRLGDNLFGQSLVCVDAETGERVLALSARPPRLVGLRPAHGPGLDGHHRGQPPGQGGRPDYQAGLCLCLRPGDRRAGLADRGAAGAPVQHAG